MSCLTLAQIYSYIEGETSFRENKRIASHISRCPKCRDAVYDRARMHEASKSLPLWSVPEDFARQIMMRIPPYKEPLWRPLAAIVAGFSMAAISVFAYLLVSGQNLASFFINISQTVVGMIRSLSVGAVKAFKIISIAFKVIWEIGSALLSIIGQFSQMMSTELQVALVCIASLLYILLFLGIKKKLFTGERM